MIVAIEPFLDPIEVLFLDQAWFSRQARQIATMSAVGPEQNLPLHYRAFAAEFEAAEHRRSLSTRPNAAAVPLVVGYACTCAPQQLSGSLEPPIPNRSCEKNGKSNDLDCVSRHAQDRLNDP